MDHESIGSVVTSGSRLRNQYGGACRPVKSLEEKDVSSLSFFIFCSVDISAYQLRNEDYVDITISIQRP